MDGIMENTVHIPTSLSFILILWDDYEEKRGISNKLWNNQSKSIWFLRSYWKLDASFDLSSNCKWHE